MLSNLIKKWRQRVNNKEVTNNLIKQEQRTSHCPLCKREKSKENLNLLKALLAVKEKS